MATIIEEFKSFLSGKDDNKNESLATLTKDMDAETIDKLSKSYRRLCAQQSVDKQQKNEQCIQFCWKIIAILFLVSIVCCIHVGLCKRCICSCIFDNICCTNTLKDTKNCSRTYIYGDNIKNILRNSVWTIFYVGIINTHEQSLKNVYKLNGIDKDLDIQTLNDILGKANPNYMVITYSPPNLTVIVFDEKSNKHSFFINDELFRQNLTYFYDENGIKLYQEYENIQDLIAEKKSKGESTSTEEKKKTKLISELYLNQYKCDKLE